jgi:hypothetical protein
VRRCNNSGFVKLRGLVVNLSSVLANAAVVLREVADGREELRYGPVRLGWLDRTSGKPRFERA